MSAVYSHVAACFYVEGNALSGLEAAGSTE